MAEVVTTETSLYKPGSGPFHAFAVVIRLGVLVEGLRVTEVQFKKIFDLVGCILFSWWVAFGRRCSGGRPITRVGSIAIPPWWVVWFSQPAVTPISKLHTDTDTIITGGSLAYQ